MRPTVCVVSRVAGLREAFDAHGLSGSWLTWLSDPFDRATLGSAEVLVGEPALVAPLVNECPKLAWVQSTFAGCNQLLTGSHRRDYVATRLAGCFGPDMAEYCVLHILAQERRYEEQRRLQGRREWLGARSEGGVAQGGVAWQRAATMGR